jgi:hypothetical protein
VNRIIREGSEKARAEAAETLRAMKNGMHLNYYNTVEAR